MSKETKQGETVSLELNTADASTAVAVTIKDANLNTRTLASYERLVIDAIDANVATGTADLFADINGNGTVDAGELLVSLSPTDGEFHTDGEGLNVPAGITPKVKASIAGSIKLTGTARIVAQTQSGRPNWREKLGPN